MTLLVPFDGSALAEAALERARDLADATDDELIAVTVIPDDREYATARGWLDQSDTYDTDVVERKLRSQVHGIAPNATFKRTDLSQTPDPVATMEMDVARTIRQVAADVNADVVVVGSENAGRVTRPLTSVGSPISEDPRYDVYIVRHD